MCQKAGQLGLGGRRVRHVAVGPASSRAISTPGLSLSCLTISWGTALMTEKRESSAQFRSHITIYTILFIHILENKDLADSGIL